MQGILKYCCVIAASFVLLNCGGGGGAGGGGSSQPDPVGGTPTLVESNAAQSAVNLYVDGNSQGDVVAVWTLQTNLIDQEVWANIYRPNTGWLGEQRIGNEATILSVKPVMDEAGNAIVLWSAANDGIWTSHNLGAAWSTESQLSTNGIEPFIVLDPSSSSIAVAVWTDAQRETISISEFASTAWSTPDTVPTALAAEVSAPDAYNPRVGIDGSSNIYVAWWAAGGFRQNIYTSPIGWSDADVIGDSLTRSSTLSVGTSGHALLAWNEVLPGGLSSVRVSTYAGLDWSTPVDTHIFSGVLLKPIQAIINTVGLSTVAWDQVSGSTASAKSIQHAPATGWDSTPKTVPGSLSALDSSDLSTNPTGNIVMTWPQNDGIYASFLGQTSWSNAFLVTTDDGEQPQLNLTNNSAVLVWLLSDGSNTHVWSANWIL